MAGSPFQLEAWVNRRSFYSVTIAGGILLNSTSLLRSLLDSPLQKFEDSAPDSLEFDRLKEHFEPVLRTSGSGSSAVPSSAAHSHHIHSTSITAAATAALSRDIPGVSKYNPLARSARGGAHKDKSANKDEMTEYKTRLNISSSHAGGGEEDVELIRHLEEVSEVATLEQRWGSSWATPLQTSELRPLRIPLHSKRSKRCPQCTHILIKPEQKAQSVRYKIKLVAANYLPSVILTLPHRQQVPPVDRRVMNKSTSAAVEEDSNAGLMQAGLTYPFHLSITNPLYDPIQVRLSVQRMHTSGDKEKGRRPPFAISLPTSSFTIAAFAEAWEYDDEDEDIDMFGLDDDTTTTMRKTSYGITAVGVVLVLLLNIFSSTRTDWLIVKSPEILHTRVTTRYGLDKLCEIKTVDAGSGKYTEKTCRKFPLRVQDNCETDNSGFCAAWTSAGYAVELGIGFSALSLAAILFGVSTGSRRRRIWRAVAGLVALQAVFQLVAFAIVTDVYRRAVYPSFDSAKPGTGYVFNTLSWVLCIVISAAVVVTGISADKGHRWAAGNRAYRRISSSG